ncbi:pentapeptide repeat-containing protein [Parvularcula sp. IMCC14364]|uniref:pentapeptide repeat-containing protein n=1 Tax=Parvularcula sp. IMCC14364 TaxID=3067902 RepID=UPI0027423A98|nr:pentapeptide repeat-containing protein [Parvularcula sp. IMCC14364]
MNDHISTDLSGSALGFSISQKVMMSIANLNDVGFTLIELKGADVGGANMARASFTELNFEDAYLGGIENSRQSSGISGSNIHGVRNAPDRFVE